MTTWSRLPGCAGRGPPSAPTTSRQNRTDPRCRLRTWTHCWMSPPEIHPADSTISRVSREMSKRMLCIFNVWKVKTLQHQLLTSQKKRKLGENLFTEEAEEEPTCEHTVEAYLDRLHTLLIAYAMAGVASPKSSDPAFDAKNEATLGADSTLYALVPLDVCMQYFFRAKKTVMALPASKRLAWLSTRDAEERAEWTSRFRESTASLGAIMKEVFVARDAHWMQAGHPEMPMPSSPATAASSGTPRSPSKLQLGKPINGRKVAKVMKDGTTLCQAFQHNNCKAKGKCPNGAHRCGLVVRNDRVCGGSSHGAAQCRSGAKSGWWGPEEEAAASSGSEQADSVMESAPERLEAPLMADVMSGPNAPLTKAFLFYGWRCITLDWLLDPAHDLSDPAFQSQVHNQFKDIGFLFAALDCSTKSRAREIPVTFSDGRPGPRPLRTDAFPEGVPSLSDRDRKRVETDNKACYFILDEIQQLHDRGGGSIRENPSRSLHWMLPQEQEMMASGQWSDTTYSACCLRWVPEPNSSGCATTSPRWPNGPCWTATTSITLRNGSRSKWRVKQPTPHTKKPSIQPPWRLPLQGRYPCGRSEQAKQRWRFTLVFPLSKWSAIDHTGCSWTHEPCGNGQWLPWHWAWDSARCMQARRPGFQQWSRSSKHWRHMPRNFQRGIFMWAQAITHIGCPPASGPHHGNLMLIAQSMNGLPTM